MIATMVTLGGFPAAVRRFYKLVFWTALLLMRAASAQADWVNLSGAEVAPNIAEIYVEDDGVRVVLEAYIADLETFADLIPAAWYDQTEVVILPDNERLQHFGIEGLTVRDGDGTLLIGLI